MSMDTKSPVRSVKDLETVVDTDMHLTEQEEDFLPYLEPPFDEILSRSADDGKYAARHKNFYSTTVSGFISPVGRSKAQSEDLRTREDILRAMDIVNTDKVIITPSKNLHLPGVNHSDLAPALAAAYNEFLINDILDSDHGLYGGTVVAPQKPVEAAEQIEKHANDPGIACVMVPSAGLNPPLGDEKYYPIYEAAEDAGLPIIMHNSTTAAGMRSFPIQMQGFQRWLSMHTFGHVAQHMVHLPSMITRGIPVRFPDLDFVFQEAGIGWVPFMTRRLDDEFSANKEDAPMLEKKPSEYIYDQFYFTSQPVEGTGDPEYVSQIVRLAKGEDNLMWSSDYPHFDFDQPDEIMKLLNSFDDDELANIFGETASNVFDLS